MGLCLSKPGGRLDANGEFTALQSQSAGDVGVKVCELDSTAEVNRQLASVAYKAEAPSQGHTCLQAAEPVMPIGQSSIACGGSTLKYAVPGCNDGGSDCAVAGHAAKHTGSGGSSAAVCLSQLAAGGLTAEPAPAATAGEPVAAAADMAADQSDIGVSISPSGQSYTGTGVQPAASALAKGNKQHNHITPRTVMFEDPASESGELLPALPIIDGRPRNVTFGGLNHSAKSLPRRSRSQLPQGSRRSIGGGLSEAVLAKQVEAVLAKQVEILRSNKMGKLKQRRGGLDSSFRALQESLEQNEKPIAHVNTRAAGLKHIGFGPFKRENQDEFFIQVGDFGGQHSSNLFCVFDGHGSCGKDAALYSRQLLPRLLDKELAKYFERVTVDSEEGLKGAIEMLITEVFGETERSVIKFGVNLASSGTTASVAYQRGNCLWVASAGDSRAILCTRNARDQWRAVPLTIDHRPSRSSERERIEAAGARVAPKRLPSGRTVGEPRMWLQNASGPGLLLSRSLGDLTAATVGCTSDPEVSFTTLRPGVDHVLVMATDGVWDVLTNEQVCDIVVESPDPHIACRRVLDAALYEWEERMSADNITVLVVEFDWGEDGSFSTASMEQISAGGNSMRAEQDAAAGLSEANTSVAAISPAMLA